LDLVELHLLLKIVTKARKSISVIRQKRHVCAVLIVWRVFA